MGDIGEIERIHRIVEPMEVPDTMPEQAPDEAPVSQPA